MNLKKIEHEINFKQLIYDEEWIKYQTIKGRLNYVLWKKLFLLEKELNKVYENNWEFQIKLNTSKSKIYFTLCIIIYFHEFQIKNSLKSEHTIKELFVRIPVEPYLCYNRSNITGNFYINFKDSFYFSSIYGLRTRVTYAEYVNNYEHSHLDNIFKKKLNYTSFCLGSGEISQLSSILNEEFNDLNFEMYLFQLKQMLQWESREGVPYRYMNDIFLKNTDLPFIDNNYDFNYIINIVGTIKNNYFFNILLRKDKYIIKQDFIFDQLCQDIVDYIKINNLSKIISYLCYKDVKENYHNIKKCTIKEDIIFDDNYIPFKGIKYIFKLDTDEYKADDSAILYLHPYLQKLLKKHYERKINKKIIRDQIVKNYSSGVSI